MKPPSSARLSRRRFITSLGIAGGGAVMAGCAGEFDGDRYTATDKDALQRQREREQASAGRGPFGAQVYRGYRGLAELPWFSLDADGKLVCHGPKGSTSA